MRWIPISFRHPILLWSIFLCIMPFIFRPLGVTPTLATEILIFCIFAVGFNILLGYTGIVSFGNAAFFGIGAYVTGIAQIHLMKSTLIPMLLGVMLATLAAIVFGFLIIRKRGIYFALLTIAFGQILYFIVFRWTEVTGGENGLSGIDRFPISIPNLFSIDISSHLTYYYFVLFILILCLIAIWQIVHSPFGSVLQAIRENENRAKFLGYNVQRYRHISFVLSGFFAGVAGTLYALLYNFAFAETLHWTMSGEVVIMTLMGGMGNFFGPLIGAGLLILLKDIVSSYTDHWMIVMGTIFITFVLLTPEGITGLLMKMSKKKIEANQRID